MEIFDALFITTRRNHGGGVEAGIAPMYYLIPVGAVLGVVVVVLFEMWCGNFSVSARLEQFKRLTHKEELGKGTDPEVEKMLGRTVDGISNVSDFWSGGAMHCQASREQYLKAYEMLALVCALLLSIGVSFYTAQPKDHLFGLVACIANCALWMGTLSSAFFAVMINTCESDEQLTLLIGLYGPMLMRTPMMMFVWGTVMIFLEFVLYFKLNVDGGLRCSLCLGTCLIIAPLFFHCMHKLGWAVGVVQAEAEAERKSAKPPTAPEIRADLLSYISSKGDNPLALDRDQFLYVLKTKPGACVTSVQRAFAKQLFDDHVEVELEKLMEAAASPGVKPKRLRRLSFSESANPPGQTLVGQLTNLSAGFQPSMQVHP